MIVDWKYDDTSSPPVKKVLVQWAGLAPEDTSWESWDELARAYDFEGKVDFGDESVDSNKAIAAKHTPTNIQAKRPKRLVKRPNYLREYV